MKVHATALAGVMVVESPVFRDDRGFFTEVHHAEKFAGLGLPTRFQQDNHSRSIGGTLRGLHYQLRNPQGKLVRVVTGAIFDVAVDLRRASPTFGQWCGVRLEEGDGRQVWIPPGFGHGFLVLSESADVTYKCTTPYDAATDRSLAWNDPVIAVQWPLTPGMRPLLSTKDASAPTLETADVFP